VCLSVCIRLGWVWDRQYRSSNGQGDQVINEGEVEAAAAAAAAERGREGER